MLQYSSSSWHYRLVLYVYGKWFFTVKYTDFSIIRTDEERKKLSTYPEYYNSVKVKHVNFCPYCRAVLGSIFLLPFSIIYKLFPHKEKKDLTWDERKKKRDLHFKIMRAGVGCFNITLGLKNIFLDQDMLFVGLFQIFMGLFLMFLPQSIKIIRKITPPIRTGYNKIKLFLIRVKIIRIKIKYKPKKIDEDKKPNFISAFFEVNHDKYCPPVFFTDDKNNE